MNRILPAFLVAYSLIACGDDGGSGTGADARIVGMDAALECEVDEAYGTPTLAEVYAGRDLDTNPESAYINGSINTDFDDLTIELYKGFGVYTDGELVPTTVTIGGDEANYDTCGACVMLYANWNRETSEAEQLYIAIGGTLNITQVAPNFQGTLLNATFERIVEDADRAYVKAPGNCVSSIASVSFDAVVETDPPK
ncbi:MAG: hypothetical protein ACKV2T_41640 [Kofleriaceae bacterium]